jgi:parallel beta-helix repeat protein
LGEAVDGYVSGNNIQGGSDSGDYGIYSDETGSYVRIIGNMILGCQYGVYLNTADIANPIISGNRISPSGANIDTIGIAIFDATRPLVSNNMILCPSLTAVSPSPNGRGIYIEDSPFPNVVGNTIDNAPDVGIELVLTGATSRMFNVSNNFIDLYGHATYHGDAGTPYGILIRDTSTGNWNGTMNGNHVYIAVDMSANLNVGIDIADCLGVACTGNMLTAGSSGAASGYYDTEFSANANHQGLGQAPFASNTATYNYWIT